MEQQTQRGMKVIVALMLGFAAIGLGILAAPQAQAATSSRGYIPDYVQCSAFYGPIEYSARLQQAPGSGNSATGDVDIWYDSHDHTVVCHEQGKVWWTTSSCPSGRKLDVYFTNGVSGDKYTQLTCGTGVYTSSFTYSDVCTYYLSARTTDSYQATWYPVTVC